MSSTPTLMTTTTGSSARKTSRPVFSIRQPTMLRSLLAHKFEAVAIEQPFVFGVGQDLGLKFPRWCNQ